MYRVAPCASRYLLNDVVFCQGVDAITYKHNLMVNAGGVPEQFVVAWYAQFH